MKGLILALCLFMAVPVSAQSRFTLPTENERQAANIASWVTLGVEMGLDAKASWGCGDGKRVRCFEMQALRTGGVMATGWAVNKLFPRNRPCAPSCGADNPTANRLSMHMAQATAAIPFGQRCSPGPRVGVQWSLAVGTGAGRWFSARHDLPALALGAATGVVFDMATRCK
jgi:hypothetical protein